MVVQRTMTIDQFLPGACPAAQQQQTQGRNQPPLTTRTRKRQRTANQPPRGLEETSPRTPLVSTSTAIVIREPTCGTRPTMQVGSNVAASSSHPAVGWHTNFRLWNEPLSVTSSVRSWAQGKGAQIARSLRQGLQLLEDVHFFSDGSDGSLATRLQWHSIAVIHQGMSQYLGCGCQEVCVEKHSNKIWSTRIPSI